jgi:1,4-alpha-glucan branching enzyme
MRPPTRLSDQDLHLFNEGSHLALYEKLGAHPGDSDAGPGVHFAVWAPDAARVSVVGDWNDWTPGRDELAARARSGLWEGFAAGATRGSRYKYHLTSHSGRSFDKADPFAFYAEIPPRTASRVWSLDFAWQDQAWMADRRRADALAAPIAIYEMHLGSWRNTGGEPEGAPRYRELAPQIAEYVLDLGFTHVELLPVMEHPFYGSWGYQTTGYFAPTARYGTPQDLMFLVDLLHRKGIGVILDWVPSHFPDDPHALACFDGTHLYEHRDARQRVHPDWGSCIFNYGRHEVRSFLLSSALYWLDVFHADGLRVDAVASMLYLDYSRKPGEWIPNARGGRENLEAIELLQRLNTEVRARHPGAQTFAEESTSWPMVSRSPHLGGLGFGFKWDMGWMHDTLRYMSRDPVHRKHHHGELSFRSVYAFHESFVLPLSHDEVVHGKGSLLGRMPGDDWQRFANLRLLLGCMYAQPGKKLLFMGGELGQWREWNHSASLDWHLLEHAPHRGIQQWVRDLNRAYRAEPALHERDCDPSGFAWIDAHDWAHSTLSFLRRGGPGSPPVVVSCNFTPVPRHRHRIGVPDGGTWTEILNSDATPYGGSGQGNLGAVESRPLAWHGQPHSLEITLPPLAVVMFRGGAP